MTDGRLIGQDDTDAMSTASFVAKFRVSDMEKYSGIDCPLIHFKLYSTVIRAHLYQSGWCLEMLCFSLLQSHLGSGTWEDLTDEFLSQYAFNSNIDGTRTEHKTVKKLPNETITAFISRCRAKVIKMIKRPKKRNQVCGYSSRTLHLRSK